MPPWIVPWNIMLPAVAGCCAIVASASWVIGRASLRQALAKSHRQEAYENAIIARQRSQISVATKENAELRSENRDLRDTVRSIIQLGSNTLGISTTVKVVDRASR